MSTEHEQGTGGDYQGRDTLVDPGAADAARGLGSDRAASAEAGIEHPDTERDAAGIPVFIFKQTLPEADKPTDASKMLEVMVMWRETVMSVGHYSRLAPITVGGSPKADFRVAAKGLPADCFKLVDVHNGGFVVRWADAMACEVRNAQGEIFDGPTLRQKGLAEQVTLDGQPGNSYRVGLNDRVAVQAGDLTFVVQYVSPSRVVPTPLIKTLDFYFTRTISLSFLAHAFLLLALVLTPLAPHDFEEDLLKNPNRFAKLLLKEQEKQPDKKKFELSGSKGGGRHKDEEGKFGKKDKPKKDALASTKGAPNVDPNKREKDRKIALESGIFAALKGGSGSNVSNVLGPGGLGTGINNAIGGLRGTAMGDAGGSGGLGTRGTGPGGGGNSLGIGGLGNGTGRGTGGLGNVDLGGKGKGNYKVVPGRTITQGCLTQQQVLRVLTRVQSQAKYCYEKELTKNPNLEGKVTTMFEIGPTGGVTWVRITESTMGNSAVEQCLERVVQRLRFPPCQGGGTAEITYPWIFKSGGG